MQELAASIISAPSLQPYVSRHRSGHSPRMPPRESRASTQRCAARRRTTASSWRSAIANGQIFQSMFPDDVRERSLADRRNTLHLLRRGDVSVNRHRHANDTHVRIQPMTSTIEVWLDL